jgi:hypothetical protein
MIYHHSIGNVVARERIADLVAEARADNLAAQAARPPRRRPLLHVLLAWRRWRGGAPAIEASLAMAAEPHGSNGTTSPTAEAAS